MSTQELTKHVPENDVQNRVADHLGTLTSRVGLTENEYVRLFSEQAALHVVSRKRTDVGGILPISIDPETKVGYCLMGLARRHWWRCEKESDYLYRLPDGQIGGMINDLCHFHGWSDFAETLTQTKAREGYEESCGLFGSYVDLWRCLSLEGFSYQMPCIKPMSLINLGPMTATQRLQMERQFLQCPVTIPAMVETRGVRFFALDNHFYEVMRDCRQNFSSSLSMSLVDPVQFPNNSVFLRSFVKTLLTALEAQPALPPRCGQSIPPTKNSFPNEICLQWCDKKVFLVTQTERALPTCGWCHHNVKDEFYYRSEDGEEVRVFHVTCLLSFDKKTQMYELKCMEELMACSQRLAFFEDHVIKRILAGDGFDIKPITELPLISTELRQVLETMLNISLQVQKEFNMENHAETRQSIQCQECGDIVYIREQDSARYCSSCRKLQLLKRKEGLMSNVKRTSIIPRRHPSCQ